MFTFVWNDYFFAKILTMKNLTLPLYSSVSVQNRGVEYWYIGTKTMLSMIVDLPIELEEAAMVDGATHIGAFLKVAVPLSVPAIAAASLIMFTFAWNDYFFVSVLMMKN